MVTHRYLPFLERMLTPKRLQHSLGVMQVMGDLAGVYRLDREKALTVGLLHDAAKDLDPPQQMTLMEEAGVEIRCDCDKDWVYYLHGPVGAYLVQKELAIQDPLILNAIAMHTYYGYGDGFDEPMTWCVRFSDILEPGRDWSAVKWLRNGLERLRTVVYAGRLEEGALLQTGWLLEWFEEDGLPIHPNLRLSYENLSTKLKVDHTFLESNLSMEKAG